MKLMQLPLQRVSVLLLLLVAACSQPEAQTRARNPLYGWWHAMYTHGGGSEEDIDIMPEILMPSTWSTAQDVNTFNKDNRLKRPVRTIRVCVDQVDNSVGYIAVFFQRTYD